MEFFCILKVSFNVGVRGGVWKMLKKAKEAKAEVIQMFAACKRIRIQNKAKRNSKSDKWSDWQREYQKLKAA